MTFLIIEDDPNKAKQLVEFFQERDHNDTILMRMSYQSGLKEIFTQHFDFILLDMQLPNFDIKPGEDGYKYRQLAGEDILKELKRKKRKSKVIIVTQFETFGEGDSFITLPDLKRLLKKNYSENYIDTVYYNPSLTVWKADLSKIIENSSDND
jgi:CheY-like chemotaxis protein